MNFKFKSLAITTFMTIGMLYSSNVIAQSACCKGKEKGKISCSTNHKHDKKGASCGSVTLSTAKTSGCAPSSCRGAKTKFGEAKVISSLRNKLIELKSEMEQSKQPKFEERSYDIHKIVGKSDEESLKIIVRELNLIEQDFFNKTGFKPLDFILPDNKAKQIKYLSNRIETLIEIL